MWMLRSSLSVFRIINLMWCLTPVQVPKLQRILVTHLSCYSYFFGWSCLPNVSETSAGCSAVRTLVSHQVDMNIAVVTVVVATRQWWCCCAAETPSSSWVRASTAWMRSTGWWDCSSSVSPVQRLCPPLISVPIWNTASQHNTISLTTSGRNRPMTTTMTNATILITRTRMQRRTAAGGRQITTTTTWCFSYQTSTTGDHTAGLTKLCRTLTCHCRQRGTPPSHRELETRCLRALMTTVVMDTHATVVALANHWPQCHHCQPCSHHSVDERCPGISGDYWQCAIWHLILDVET